MSDIIKLILSLSLSGSILAIIIFALKPFIKHRLTKSIQYYMWLVVLLRLILPFSFEGSIMNNVFHEVLTATDNSSSLVVSWTGTSNNIKESTPNSTILPNDSETIVTAVNNNAGADYSRIFIGLLKQYALYLWLIGVTIALSFNIIGYFRFAKYLKQTNIPVSAAEEHLLASLAKGRKVKLAKNPFISTPMLMGIMRPCIVIPDMGFSETQLKYILLHELIHLRRLDIGVKWLSMIAACVHWFNPLMYFIKKEINHACELACDEAVIKDFNSAEKQAYGDTLIAVVAENYYPVKGIQVTMCEEKKILRERLVAIMKHDEKPRLIIGLSAVLLGVMIVGAVCLGAFKSGPNISSEEISQTHAEEATNNVEIAGDEKLDELEAAVSKAIKGRAKGYRLGEVATEGHIILESEEKDGVIKVYTIASYGAFGFENGIFTKISGSGAIPTVMTFEKSEGGVYTLLEYEEPADGGGYIESIKEMFPSRLHSQVLSSNQYYADLVTQQEAQAAEYLKSIGRTAQVSAAYVEKEFPNINVEASNKLFAELTKHDPLLNNCPHWLGTRESVENGIRYIYETSQSKTDDGYDLITFRKTTVDGTVVQETQYIILENEPVLYSIHRKLG